MNRIAYFVPVQKRDGLAVGPVSDEQFAALLGVLAEAKEQGKRPVFFLWRNEPDPEKNRKSIATLTVAVERDRPQGQNVGRKPIGNTQSAPKSDPLANLFADKKSGNTKQGW